MRKEGYTLKQGFICDKKLSELPMVEEGRHHCSQCDKIVIDVVGMSRNELQQTMQIHNGNICARYSPAQLDELNGRNKETSLTQMALKTAATVSLPAVLSLAAVTDVQGQSTSPERIIQTEENRQPEPGSCPMNPEEIPSDSTYNSDESRWLMGEVEEQIAFTGQISMSPSAGRTITGTVRDASDGVPIPFANVWVQGTEIGVSTDFDGRFELDMPEALAANERLTFSFVGYELRTLVLDSEFQGDSLEVQLEAMELLGIVMLGDLHYERPPLHKRIWYGIRSWFR